MQNNSSDLQPETVLQQQLHTQMIHVIFWHR